MKDDEELKNRLTKLEYSVLRGKETEYPFSGKYVDEKSSGLYVCKVCGSNLFSSKDKFDSGSGWPSFSDVVDSEGVRFERDTTHGMERTEVLCASCDSHLGHVFEGDPSSSTGKTYCINSICLDLQKDQQV